MNILITTGVFPPESGGPATYAKQLAERLADAGHTVTVITLSDTKTGSIDEEYEFEVVRIQQSFKLSNYIRFFWATLKASYRADVIYTLSFFSLGFLTAVCAWILRVPYLVRVGGGYLWEHFYLKSDKPPLPLRDFYKKGLDKMYPWRKRVIKYILQHAQTVVFNSQVQADIYEQAYGLTNRKNIVVIPNPVPDVKAAVKSKTASKEIVFAGRFVPMKNVKTLVQAFAQADLPDYTLVLIGDGPNKDQIREQVDKLGLTERTQFIDNLPQQELFSRIAEARLVVLPSWTDICPNFAFECLALDVPFVITEENYLPFRNQIPNMVDPHSPEDITDTIERLATNDNAYQKHKDQLARIEFSQSWDDIVQTHIDLFTKATKKS